MTDISSLQELLDVPVMDVCQINDIDQLIDQATDHWWHGEPLPFTLVADLNEAGIDIDKLHTRWAQGLV